MFGNDVFPSVFISHEPDELVYDGITMHGELTVDEMEYFKLEKTDAYLFERGTITKPLWTDDTILLMPFDNTLDAGNFPTLGNPVVKWRLYRRVVGATEFVFLEEIPNSSTNTYYDVRSYIGIEFEYGIQSVAQDGTRGGILITEAVKVSTHGWTISSLDYNEELETGKSFRLIADVNSDPISRNRDRTVHDTYAIFPKVVRGNRSYMYGGLSVSLSQEIDSYLSVGTDILRREFESFILDGTEKILKNGSSLTMRVDVDDSSLSFKYWDNVTTNNRLLPNEQPYTASFKFIEVSDDVLGA